MNTAYERGVAAAQEKYRVETPCTKPQLPLLKLPEVGWSERKTPPAKLSK